ncbi:MAG TPA: ThiF family adenylyltransferase, partial [Burkholderiales bacterium]|nr:ThiF family adenylyltransferase [Burkholderiales bacterium]
HKRLLKIAHNAYREGKETHAYLLGSRNADGARITTILRAGNPVEEPSMTRPDYSASAIAMLPYLQRGEKLLGEIHLHDGLIGPSSVDRNTLQTITPPGYLGMVITKFPDEREPVITAHSIENEQLIEHDVAIAPAYESLLPSHTTTIKIALVGCGSLGGLVALHLAKLNLAQITVVDGDDLEERNLARHIAEPRDVGKNKAKALRRIIKQRTTSYVRAIPLQMTEKTQARLNRIIDEHDLIINATGQPVACARLSDTSAEFRRACFHAGVFARGTGGFVFLQLPNGPTYQELFHLKLTPFADDRVTMETLRHQYGYSERDLEAQVGLFADVNTIAAITSKLVVEYLKAGALPHNLYLIDNTTIDVRKAHITKGEQS